MNAELGDLDDARSRVRAARRRRLRGAAARRAVARRARDALASWPRCSATPSGPRRSHEHARAVRRDYVSSPGRAAAAAGARSPATSGSPRPPPATSTAPSASSRTRSSCRGGWATGRSSPRCAVDLAQVLLRRGGAGDRERGAGAARRVPRRLAGAGDGGPDRRALALKLERQGLAGVDAMTSIDDVIDAVESERPDIRPTPPRTGR